jgi:hypothetical protein
MLGRSRLEFIHPDCHPAVKEGIKKLIQDAKPVAALENGFTSMVESLTVNKVIKGK